MDTVVYPIPVGGIVEGVGEVLSPEPSDVAAWLRVRKVFEAMTRPGCNNIQAACEEAQVNRSTFYNDMKDPAVTYKLATWLGQVDAVALGVMMSHWVDILVYQAELARGMKGAAKDSTPAARFIQGELAALKVQVKAEQDTGPSEAARVLQKFRERAAKVRATRTTVVEEIVLED